MKKAFTLVEIVVVLGLFGVLVLAGTEFVIQMVRANNQTIIQNEVRQNANRIMQLLTDSIRTASCVAWTNVGGNKTITTYSDRDCAGTPVDTYNFNISSTPVGRILKNGSLIISDSVAACADLGCSQNCYTNGLTSPSSNGDSKTSGTVPLSLTLQQTPRPDLRSDFCGRMTLSNTITPRQY